MSAEVESRNLVVASVLSGNRNFEGRIQQQVRANYLASPPLVVAYALAGRMTIDLTTEPLGTDQAGAPVFLRDLWPTEREIQETMLGSVTSEMFRTQYADVFGGDDRWKTLPVPTGSRFAWDPDSTYIRNPPFFDGLTLQTTPLKDITGARVLAMLGDSITTDHISPAGSIKKDSPAGKYLMEHGVDPRDFNSYGARRGNHEVMMRGTFANIRLRNQLAPGTEGGWTTYQPGGEVMTIYDAAMKYKDAGVPLLVLAGKEYGSGSSRDWAAKGTLLLGVKVVIADSYERIHRSNLVNMGVLPLQYLAGQSASSLCLTGFEVYDSPESPRRCVRPAPSRSARSARMARRRSSRRSCASIRRRNWSRSGTAGFCRTWCGSSSDSNSPRYTLHPKSRARSRTSNHLSDPDGLHGVKKGPGGTVKSGGRGARALKSSTSARLFASASLTVSGSRPHRHSMNLRIDV